METLLAISSGDTLAAAAAALHAAAFWVGAVALVTFLLPWVWAAVTHRDQDLKARYNAEWALVTGEFLLRRRGAGVARCLDVRSERAGRFPGRLDALSHRCPRARLTPS